MCAGHAHRGHGHAARRSQPTRQHALFEVEDAALAGLQNWITKGVQPAHGTQISTIPVLFGAYDLVNKNRYGVGEGGIRMPEAQVPAEDYSALNFANVSEESLNPLSLITELEGAFESLETGSISNEAVRDEGLCLLSATSRISATPR